jgi:hypothetical protein
MRRNRVTAAVSGVIVAVGLGAGLAACSSGPSTPANATQILQSDGYTPSAAYTTAMQGGISSAGAQAGQITSSEAGTNGDNIQGVLVFDNASDAQTAAAQDPSAGGITVAQNGDVVTITGSITSWASLGSGS